MALEYLPYPEYQAATREKGTALGILLGSKK